MNHQLAETQHSVEKYILEEMSPEERTQFEEHLFDCPVCSDLVRQNFTVTENLKEVLREEKLSRAAVGWREWLRWPSLVPAFAALALACVVGYQNFGGSAEYVQAVPETAPLMTASRGALAEVHLDRKSSVLVLPVNVDKLAAGGFEGYLETADGKRLVQGIKGEKPVDTNVLIPIPTKNLQPGRLNLVLRSTLDGAQTQTYAFDLHYSN